MKQTRTYVIITLLGCIFFLGCNSQKTAVKLTETDHTTEIRQTQKDSTRTEINAQVDHKTTKQEDENTYERTTDYDSLGNIRKIYEAWRSVGRIELSLCEGSQHYLSLTGSSIIDTVNHSFKIINYEETKQKIDTRPIQHAEWLWAIAGLILVVIIYLVIKKRLWL